GARHAGTVTRTLGPIGPSMGAPRFARTMGAPAMDARRGRSWVALRLLQGAAFIVLLVLAGSVPSGTSGIDGDFEAFLRHTTDQWCATPGKREDLQAVVVDVRFRADPLLFKQGEGTVVAPVAID